MNKYSENKFDPKALGYAALFGLPTMGVLGLGGMGLSKLLGLKKRYLGLGLPAAYLAYLATKEGNGGLNLHKGLRSLDKFTYPLNVLPYAYRDVYSEVTDPTISPLPESNIEEYALRNRILW